MNSAHLVKVVLSGRIAVAAAAAAVLVVFAVNLCG